MAASWSLCVAAGETDEPSIDTSVGAVSDVTTRSVVVPAGLLSAMASLSVALLQDAPVMPLVLTFV